MAEWTDADQRVAAMNRLSELAADPGVDISEAVLFLRAQLNVITSLLVTKGVITRDEYTQYLAIEANSLADELVSRRSERRNPS